MIHMRPVLGILALLSLLAGPLFSQVPEQLSKPRYLTQVEQKVAEWDRVVTKLKANRDKFAVPSVPYKELNVAVLNIEDELKAVREELRNLRGSSEVDWSEYRKDIQFSLERIQTVFERVKTE